MLARSPRIFVAFLITSSLVTVPPASIAAVIKGGTPKTKAKRSKPVKIVGSNRNDVLNGTSGADQMRGKNGNDILNGNGGDDTISGDAGNDVIRGGPGVDVLLGGAGNDRIYARDGEPDTIACGKGRDIVWADSIDVVTADCEIVNVDD